MLDENVVVVKPDIIVIDWTMFFDDRHPQLFYRFDRAGRLAKLSTTRWIVIAAMLDVDVGLIGPRMSTPFAAMHPGLITGTITVGEETLSQWDSLTNSATVVYAPRIVSVHPRMHRLPYADSAEQFLDCLLHFQDSIEPFTLDNYRRFLNSYPTKRD